MHNIQNKMVWFFICCYWILGVTVAEAFDPTKPYNAELLPEEIKVKLKSKKNSGLKIEAILGSDMKRVAIVNGKVVSKGEIVSDFTILTITKDQVVMRNEISKEVISKRVYKTMPNVISERQKDDP